VTVAVWVWGLALGSLIGSWAWTIVLIFRNARLAAELAAAKWMVERLKELWADADS
jgi:hypothetical protein